MLLLQVLTVLAGVVTCMRPRTCCKYTCDSLPCPAWCHHQDDCVLRNVSGLIEERTDACRVTLDSKKEKTEDSIENCLKRSYTSSERGLGSGQTYLPFYVALYPFRGVHQLDSHFREGLEGKQIKDSLIIIFLGI